jgi:hypothetical protein
MLRHVALIITDVSEEFSPSFIRVTRIGELGTLAVTSNRRSERRLLVTADVVLHGGHTFFGQDGSYKSHTAPHPIR